MISHPATRQTRRAMPLRSRLFRDDPALQACLVKDSAHVTLGTRGAHVPKIQRALAMLDGALIATGEVQTALYGKTTAAAVLAYKRQRKIINRNYQSQADDIVGKMTIERLDDEIATLELAGRPRGCTVENRGGLSARSAIRDDVVRAVGDGPAPSGPKAVLRVVFQVAKTPSLPAPSTFQLLSLIRRGNELLAPHGLKLAPQAALDSFPYTHSVDTKNAGDVAGLRKAAEKAAPGHRGVLRFIFCEYESGIMHETATSQGRATTSDVDRFENFVIMNPQTVHPDRGTLVHEAVHCSNDRFMGDQHDDDPSSIFAHAANRTVLKPQHARFLRAAFFGPGA